MSLNCLDNTITNFYERHLYIVRSIKSVPPLQNAVSHTTAERMQLLPDTAVPCGGVTRHFAAVARLWLYAL
jgi:hypothetical protein